MTAEERLLDLADAKNADFVARLIPHVPREKILGVRAPAITALARELRGTEEAEAFLARLPHDRLDENNLHAALLSAVKDYDRCLALLEAFLPHVDNWATCDSLRPAPVKKNRADFRGRIERWLSSEEPYTVRFGIEMLMCHYLDESFEPEQNERVAAIRFDHYYVRMMQAWYFATALAKQWDATVPLLERRELEDWTHRKTIQKAIESFRVSDERKAYLRTLK